MLTTSHAALTCLLYHPIRRTRKESIAVTVSAIIPDIEILIWFKLFLLKKYFSINLFNIDYDNLLFGSGISFYFWPWTLFTNSLITSTLLFLILLIFFKNSYRLVLLCWCSIVFHIFIDCFTHELGNMIFWPFSTTKYLGIFEFNSLPLSIIIPEQIIAITFLVVYFWPKKRID
jgi:hypothetical protein